MQFINLKSWKKYCIHHDVSILEATKKLNRLEHKTLLIYKNNFNLIGTVTDGDLRRSIINGFSSQNKVSVISNKNPITIEKYKDINFLKKKIITYDVKLLPKINRNQKKNTIKDVYVLSAEKFFFKDDNYQNPIIIMAGGQGKRLGSITKNTPKPLLKINKSSPLEKIINNFIDQKFTNISISIHHMAEKIVKELAPYKNKIELNFIKEINPLGTLGSIKLIDKKFNNNKLPIIVVNADIISNININRIIKFHKSSRSEITVVSTKYLMKNPYGVLRVNNQNLLKDIIEKPTIQTLINAGVYIINYELTKFIKKNIFLNVDTFLKKMISKKKRISVYKLENYWYEIGNTKEYQFAKKIIK
jgi:dTDP-glucose pyrophosphorylase